MPRYICSQDAGRCEARGKCISVQVISGDGEL